MFDLIHFHSASSTDHSRHYHHFPMMALVNPWYSFHLLSMNDYQVHLVAVVVTANVVEDNLLTKLEMVHYFSVLLNVSESWAKDFLHSSAIILRMNPSLTMRTRQNTDTKPKRRHFFDLLWKLVVVYEDSEEFEEIWLIVDNKISRTILDILLDLERI